MKGIRSRENYLNGQNFAKYVSSKRNISQEKMQEAIDLFVDGITLALSENKRVTIIDFCSFYNVLRPTRKGYNIQTGQYNIVKEFVQPMCVFGKKLRKTVNVKGRFK